MKPARLLPRLFLALWALSLFVLAIGTYGWFGQERDGLSGVYMILLGMPWVSWLDGVGLSSPWTAILAPGINLLILIGLSRLLARRRG